MNLQNQLAIIGARSGSFDLASLSFYVTVHVFLYPSRPTWCRLSPRWPGVRADAVVCA